MEKEKVFKVFRRGRLKDFSGFLPSEGLRRSLSRHHFNESDERKVMTKVGGGINPVHLSDTKHPFEISTKRGSFTGTSKFAKTVGVNPPPGGEGNLISANSSMKKKRPLNGPGDAK